MKWKKYTLETLASAEETVSALLCGLGIDSLEIEDDASLTEEDCESGTPASVPQQGNGSTRISFYLEEEEDDRELLAKLTEDLRAAAEEMPLGSLKLTRGETEDTEWINNWKQYYHSFTVGRIRIEPAWEELPLQDGEILIKMDPGTAFGCGTHETTRLCLEGLQEAIRPGMRVLDVGTGSGILSLAAVKLGADFALGTELAADAAEAAAENRERNGIPAEKFRVLRGNILDDPAVQSEVGEGYDLVLANIFAPVIIALSGEIGRHMKKGALIVTSGILKTQAAEVEKAFSLHPDFELLPTMTDGDWVSVRARRR